MELDFVNRVTKITLFLAAIGSCIFGLIYGIYSGFGIFGGALWSCINLIFIKYLIKNTIVKERNYFKIFTLVCIKFPLLYLIGYGLLAFIKLPPWDFLIGFSLIFLGIFARFASDELKKATLLIFTLFISNNLHASIEADVPEIPNLLTLLNLYFSTPLTAFLHHWENIIYSIGLAIGLCLVFHFGINKKAIIPTGIQNFLEWAVENLQKFLLDILGTRGQKFVPFLGTLFIYILCMNWLVLIPLMKPPSSDLNITVALALCVFCLVQYLNIKNFGFFGFFYHMAGSPKTLLEWTLVPLIFSIELITQFTRPLTLSLRLFGNVVGEDILIGAFALFGVTLLADYNTPVGLPLQVPFMFLAVLTGFMQALVFTILSAVYILLSMPHEEKKLAQIEQKRSI